jgi:rhamnose transport system permease protein
VILVAVLINARGAGRRSRQILPLHGLAAKSNRSAA